MSEPEHPRSEPEILPPERKSRPFRSGWDDARRAGPESFRIYVGRVSPFQMTLYGVLAVLVIAAILFVFASILAVVIPALALLVAGGFIAAYLRRWLRGRS